MSIVERASLTMGKVSRASPGERSKYGAPDPRPQQCFSLNYRRLHKLKFVTPDRRRTRQAEEFRLIKRRLLERLRLQAHESNLREEHGKVVLITSSRPQEGKTFTSVNLALSIAIEQREKVIL